MENEKESLFNSEIKLAKNLAQIDVLEKIRNMIEEVKKHNFLTYKIDEEKSDVYHIYFNGELMETQTFPEPDMITNYLRFLEYGFSKGCVWAFGEIVNYIQESVKKD